MRYVTIEQLKPQMIVGRDLFDAKGNVLLTVGSTIKADNITYLEIIGIPGVYIDDEMTRDVAVKEVISTDVQAQAVSLVSNIFSSSAEEGEVSPEENLIRLIVEDVVSGVISNKDVMYNMIDIKTYDDYTYFHSMNVGVVAGVLGAKMDMPEERLHELVTAGFLHDIGKVFVDPELVNAPRPLTDEETKAMRRHPGLGYDFLREKFHFSETVNLAVAQHHEWYNGAGYPYGLKGDETLFESRLLQVADVYDAMTSKRPYRAAYAPGDVMEYIMGRSGMEFDPSVVSMMASQFCIYPVGTEVLLSTNEHAIVLENHIGFVGRPTVRLIDTKKDIDLHKERFNVTIIKVFI